MSIYNELSYNAQKVIIEEVKGIQFSVLGPDEIIKRSVVKVTKTDTYAGSEPIVGGLFDPRMGVLEHNKVCTTCEQKNVFCPGHFGHIELAKPVFHAMFFDIVKKILKCVCFRCSRMLISQHTTIEELKNEMTRILAIKNNQKRWEAYFKLCNTTTKIKICGDDKHIGCGSKQPDRYNKEASMKIIAEWKDKSKETLIQQEFTAEDVLRIFKRITNEDMELMGFNSKWNRPEWMICTVLPVPPPAVRPSIIEENGQRREDDLTHKLSDIIKTNNNIFDKIAKGASEETIKLITMVLQYHVFTFIDNQIPGLAPSQQRNGRRLRSVCDRMKKKEGRIRGNLNGKRVDQSARSVITPDPYISIDELGVPIRVALNITFQETVNEYNIEEMRKLIMNGSNKWPGAKYVKKTNEIGPINLKYADLGKIATELHFGDVVHRHLNDGDYVLFNRQPSLHKMSMMCHKVIIMPYQTFRLNVLDTPPYNADFDGDEMNLHCPQNIQTMSELKDLAAVPYLILAPRDGKPSIEVVQDTLVGSFRASKDYVIVADKQMANLQMVNSYFKGKLEKPSKDYTYTGKDLFSEIMPPSLFIEMTNKAGEKVVINNSKFISGTLDKLVFHNITNGLIPVIYHDYGPVEIKKFLDNTQRLICRWLLTSGFSIGISDLVTDTSTDLELNNKIKEMKASAYKKLEDMRKGDLENNSIFSNEEFLEREIIGILNQTTNEVAKISLAKIDERTNRMFNMVKSGSKGKETNIAQIMACVGQQNVDGRRIAYGYTDRTLPHYTKYDDGPEARGFVENSFISGLSPQEVFFHAMGGREGLIDTAVKSVTGDTPIIIIEDGECKCVNIGDWIDSKLDNINNKNNIEQFGPEDANMEMLGLSNEIYIPTADNDGNTSWGEITIVTRHDPEENLYKVITQSGREIIVPNSKTLLIWNEKEFEAIKTEEVKIGDYVPTTISLPEPPIIKNEIDMSLYINELDKEQFILNKFELNRENGVFIGLFIANGIANGNKIDFSGSVSINEKELSVLEFIKNWFEKYNITYRIKEINKTTSIIGNSSLLARFLNKFVGTNCYNIPDIAHIAPKEFIVGLLDGYFSGDGCVRETGEITAASASKKLIHGISLLCNRLGIFGKLSHEKNNNTNLSDIHIIDIRAQWSKKFASEITLTNERKNKRLEINNNKTNLHKNYKEHNNIVLDKIINITILNPDEKVNYTKLYDLTIPSTKNFMNITGLTVYDTSETGYIQRRLVKAMEDAKINYDNTVRNANGAIIQFIYGEDGMDGCKIETQLIPTIEMKFLDMEVKYNLTTADKLESYLTPEANKKITKKTFERCKEHFKLLVEDKNFIITKVNKNRKCSIINYPIPFNRIIKTCIKRRESSNIAATLTDLTPDYILDKIEELIENLYIKDTEQGMIYFHILLRVYLSPKKLIIEQNFSKSMFDWIILQVYEYFKEAIAQPSEMVGIIAAQTIGEMGTQMTLDSFHVSGTAAAVKATSGVPRLKEILSATKKTKTPTLIIYMKPDVASVKNPKMAEDGIEYIDERIEQTKSIAMSIKNSIEITNLSNILEYSEIFWDSGKLDTTIEADKGILDIYKKFAALDSSANKCRSNSPWVLRMKFNKEKMNAFGLRMIDIYTKLNKAYNKYIDCVYSDDNADECIFRIKLTEYALKDIDNKDEVAALKAMEHNIVYQVLLKGVKGINKVSLNKKKYDIYNPAEETFDKVVEWVLDTDGTNLIEILSNPNIDSTRTISNDIREIYTVLGVEAARNALYHELVNVTGEGSMNYRHLSLLIDTMTFRGNLMSIDRHGINRNASSALSKSSFEESVDMLINASIFSEYDNTSGVSPQVMLGKVPNCGSGNFDIILDEEHLIELIKNVKQTKENKYNLDDVIEDDEDDIDCLEENLAFNITINNSDECYKVEEQKIKII
jgi:DNA-directed RNA polymerase beta' subunit